MTPRPIRPIRPPDWLVRGAADVAGVSVALARSGVRRSAKPSQLVPIERALRRWGHSMAALAAVAAIRFPARVAVIDDLGSITYGELDRRVGAQAGGLAATYGLVAGSKVVVVCRNHRGLLEAGLAAARLGADVVVLTTEGSADKALGGFVELVRRQRPDLVIADEEFNAAMVGLGVPTVLAWQDGRPGEDDAADSLDRLAAGDWPDPPDPARPGTIRTLPPRFNRPRADLAGADLAGPRTPSVASLAGVTATTVNQGGLRAGEPLVINPPLSHGLSLECTMLALFHGSPLVLTRRYDARSALASVDQHRAGSMVVVPAMVRELVDLDPAEVAGYDLASLRAVICGGAALSAAVVDRFVARFGAILSTVYWTSEAGIVALAAPDDLAAAPGTVGRPVLGASVQILDDDGRRVDPGTTGRVFAGRTDTGDLGWSDDRGRLFLAPPEEAGSDDVRSGPPGRGNGQ